MLNPGHLERVLTWALHNARNGRVLGSSLGVLLCLCAACAKPPAAPASVDRAPAAPSTERLASNTNAEPTAANPPVEPSPLSLALGQRHSCLLDERNGKVRCWGDNRDGQLGDGTNEPRLKPVEVPQLPPIRKIASGKEHNCALTRSGEVYCWGLNASGQVGGVADTALLVPTLVQGLADVTRISCTIDTSCALTSEGKLWCWGALDPMGQPDSLSAAFGRPQLLAEGVTDVALNSGGICLRTATDDVLCRSALSWTRSVKIIGLDGLARLVDGSPCALTDSKVGYCWDLNLTPEELAQPEAAQIVRGALPLPWASGARQLVEGTVLSSRCAVLESGHVQCSPPRPVPLDHEKRSFWIQHNSRDLEATAALTEVAFMATSRWEGEHACVVRSGDEVWCWGLTRLGQSGSGVGAYSAALELPALQGATALAMGKGHACVIVGARVLCWGEGGAGQLGPNVSWSDEPVTLLGVEGAVALAVSSKETCAATREQGVLCWGGAFGATPLQVPGLSKSVEVAIGDHVVCGRQDSGRTRCTPYVPSDVLPTKPEDVFRATKEVFTGARQISANEFEVCARFAGGAVRCWDERPQTPSTQATLKDVSSLDLEGVRGCALVQGGRLNCWEWDPYIVEGEQAEYDGKRPELREFASAHRQIVNGLLLTLGDGYNDCVALSDGRVRCFDYAASMREENHMPGHVISGVSYPVALDTGSVGNQPTSCAITRDAQVLCWTKQTAALQRPVQVQWR